MLRMIYMVVGDQHGIDTGYAPSVLGEPLLNLDAAVELRRPTPASMIQTVLL